MLLCTPLFLNENTPLPRSEQSLPLHSRRDGETDGVGGERKGEVTSTHVRAQEMTATGSLHSSFPLFFSVHTSHL